MGKNQRNVIRFGLLGFIFGYKKKAGGNRQRVIIWNVMHCARMEIVISPCLFENLCLSHEVWPLTIVDNTVHVLTELLLLDASKSQQTDRIDKRKMQ